jgi:D-alanine-D-alanine ligase
MLPKFENTTEPVAVIVGGLDYELDDIAKTESDVLNALEHLGCRFAKISLRDPDFMKALSAIRPQLCFVVDPFYVGVAEDGTGETRDVREILDRLKLPYTGSSRAAAGLCRDKIQSKVRFRALGIDTPPDLQVPPVCDNIWLRRATSELGVPLILKPRYEGSSVGVSLCTDVDDLGRRISSLSARFSDLMVEEYIDGKEVTIGVVGTGDFARTLPPVELELLKSPIYDYETKRRPDVVNRHVPARLPADVLTVLESHARRIHSSFGCSGVSRIDYRTSGRRVVAIEINASPSLSRDEHIPRSVQDLGWFYEDLIELILADAMRRV